MQSDGEVSPGPRPNLIWDKSYRRAAVHIAAMQDSRQRLLEVSRRIDECEHRVAELRRRLVYATSSDAAAVILLIHTATIALQQLQSYRDELEKEGPGNGNESK